MEMKGDESKERTINWEHVSGSFDVGRDVVGKYSCEIEGHL